MHYKNSQKIDFSKEYNHLTKEVLPAVKVAELNNRLMEATRNATLYGMRLHIYGKVATHTDDVENIKSVFKLYNVEL